MMTGINIHTLPDKCTNSLVWAKTLRSIPVRDQIFTAPSSPSAQDRWTQADRETDRQTDRETERERQTDRDRDRKRERKREPLN